MKLIADTAGYTSWYLLPTIACGTSDNGGWLYVLWLKARLGFRYGR